jgi:hypothetical protein
MLFAIRIAPPLWITLASFALAVSSAQYFSAPASAFQDWTIDPDTGLVCVSSDCTYVRAPNNSKCICEKVGSTNDISVPVRLKCVQKSGGRWIPCEN